jgi:hypothetical protein
MTPCSGQCSHRQLKFSRFVDAFDAMSWQTELQSWMFPSALPTNEVPKVGDKAPFSSKLSLPDAEGKPVIVTFLRHCGCPCMSLHLTCIASVADGGSRGEDLSQPMLGRI